MTSARSLSSSGLSPQARGEHRPAASLYRRCGPIPAGAGGTCLHRMASRRMWAYPRRRGGNLPILGALALALGLSPQARGELGLDHGVVGPGGPIPAGAGGTAQVRHIVPRGRAYPRRRGGNALLVSSMVSPLGLSPQARGELHDRREVVGPQGPIPAGAGGTCIPEAMVRMARAYPRRRGGNRSELTMPNARVGLSPQARGEQTSTILFAAL